MSPPLNGSRILRFLSHLVLGALFVACGGPERIAGNNGPTTGTEAGNAFTARVMRLDGSPAAGAVVKARRTGSVEDSSSWPSGIVDSTGRVRLVVDTAGAWTVEFAEPGAAVLRRIARKSDSVIDSSVVLMPTAVVVGKVRGGVPGAKIALAGLGRTVALDADTMFRFEGLPADSLVLLLVGGQGTEWSVDLAPGQTKSVVLDARTGSAVAADPEIAVRSPHGRIPSGALIPLELGSPAKNDPQASWNDYRLLDAEGAIVPSFLERRDSGTGISRLWIRSPEGATDSGFRLRIVSSAVAGSAAPSPFAAPGIESAVLFDTISNGSASDLAHPVARLQGIHSTASLASDPVFGGAKSLSASFGPDLVTLDSSGFPSSGAGGFAMRFRLLDPTFGRLWLFQANDSASSRFVRVGWGSGRFVLQAGGESDSISMPSDAAPHVLSVARSATAWTASLDGIVALSVPIDSVSRDAIWARRVVGRGAGIAIKDLFVFQGEYAEPRIALLAGKISIERSWP